MDSIRFNVDSVLTKLSQVASVVNGKSILPVFDCVRFFDDDGKFTLMASDGETWVKEHCSGVVCDFSFDFCVNARNIVSTFRNLSSVDVEIKIDTTKKLLYGLYGKKGKFQLPIIDGSDFVEATKIDESSSVHLSVNKNKFLVAIDNTSFAVANDELHPVMNGIHFDLSSDCLECASSDGTKLVYFADYSIKGDNDKKGFTLPTKPASILSQIMSSDKSDEVNLVFNADHVKFVGEFWEISTRLCVGNYPNYKAVIPTANENKAVIDKSCILSILNRIMPFGNDNSKLVRLTFDKTNQELLLTTEDIDWATSAQESMSCEYNGELLCIGFKGDLFVQIIKNIKCDKIIIEMNSKQMAAIFRPYDDLDETKYVSILMPMKID